MSETEPEIQWFIQIADGKKAGPISWEHLKKFMEQKRLLPETKVRSTQSGSVWVPAGTIPNLFGNNNETVPTQTTLSETIEVTEKPEEKTTPAEKKESPVSSVSSFSINTGTKQSHSNVAVKPVIKIDTKKSAPKENKEEKKSTGIFSLGVQKSKTKNDEKKNDSPVKISEPEKKKTSDQSASAINIAISPPKEKNKNKEKSSTPATVVISAKPTQETTTTETIIKEESPPETFSESEESDEIVAEITAATTVTETNLKQHEKKKEVQLSLKNKTGIISLLLITLAVLSVLIGGVGGVGIFLLGYYAKLAIFSAALGTIIFLFGMILGTASWFLALLFNQPES